MRRTPYAVAVVALLAVNRGPADADPPVACDYARASYEARQLPFQSDQQSTKEYFSPNSTKIVFAEGGQVKVFDIPSSSVMTPPLTELIGARWPSWTEGGKIFFEGPAQTGGDNALKPPSDPPPVYVMDENGANQVLVETSELPAGDPTRGYRAGGNGYFKVSTDGKKVAFNYGPNSLSTDPHNAFWFYVADVVYESNGGVRFADPVQLSSDTTYWSEAKGWSGNSSKIVFASTRGEEGDRRALNSDAYAIDLATGQETRLTHAPTWEEAADVLRGDLGPGDAITFISDRDTPQPEQAQYGVSDRIPSDMDWALVASAAVPLATWTSHEIFVAGPEGDHGWVRRLTFDYDKDGTNSRAPKWSPDGMMISFRQSAGSPEARVDERAGQREESMMLLTFDCGG